MAIRAIILDIGGVLLHERDYSKRTEWESRLGLAQGELERLVTGSELAKLAPSGKIDEREIWRAVASKLGLTDAQTWELQSDFWACEQLDTEFVAFLKSLCPRYRMAILSNAWSDAHKFHDAKFHFNSWVELSIYSAEVHLLKPDPHIYQLMLSQLKLQANECMFVDDKLINVQAAKALGMKGVCYRDSAQAIKDIKKILDA
jgi:putative hydrolase of the HAD superfamily